MEERSRSDQQQSNPPVVTASAVLAQAVSFGSGFGLRYAH